MLPALFSLFEYPLSLVENPLATGQDGQILKIDWDGNALGAIGNGPGRGEGQFVESNYMAMDAKGNLYSGDTSGDRITKMIAPRK